MSGDQNRYINPNDINNMRKHSDYLKLKHDIDKTVQWILRQRSPIKKLLEEVTTIARDKNLKRRKESVSKTTCSVKEKVNKKPTR